MKDVFHESEQVGLYDAADQFFAAMIVLALYNELGDLYRPAQSIQDKAKANETYY